MRPLCLFVLVLNAMTLDACMFHQNRVEQEWKEEGVSPFDELMISWNAERPNSGKYLIYASVKTEKWSPWLLYASWGSNGQASYLSTTEEAPVKVYQDALEVLNGEKANAFRIKIEPEGDALLSAVRSVHVYTNCNRAREIKPTSPHLSSVYLPVAGVSQMALDHVRNKDLCSPTSTAAVVRYLSRNNQLDPILFATKAWDAGFNIFGNWVFNVAQAAAELGASWNAWVERLSSFDDIHQRLQQGAPVIVSIRGPLPGSAAPYAQGHLIAVIGYDAESSQVICMDPAFASDSQTHVRYALTDFIQAWGRRGRIAYVFHNDP